MEPIWIIEKNQRSQIVAIRRAVSQLEAALHQLKENCPCKPEELTNEDNIKTLIKVFTYNNKAVPEVQQNLAQLQESMGLASSLPQLFPGISRRTEQERKTSHPGFQLNENKTYNPTEQQ